MSELRDLKHAHNTGCVTAALSAKVTKSILQDVFHFLLSFYAVTSWNILFMWFKRLKRIWRSLRLKYFALNQPECVNVIYTLPSVQL